jgi:hypothetical protein
MALSSVRQHPHVLNALLPFMDCKPDSEFTMIDGAKDRQMVRWDGRQI